MMEKSKISRRFDAVHEYLNDKELSGYSVRIVQHNQSSFNWEIWANDSTGRFVRYQTTDPGGEIDIENNTTVLQDRHSLNANAEAPEPLLPMRTIFTPKNK